MMRSDAGDVGRAEPRRRLLGQWWALPQFKAHGPFHQASRFHPTAQARKMAPATNAMAQMVIQRRIRPPYAGVDVAAPGGHHSPGAATGAVRGLTVGRCGPAAITRMSSHPLGVSALGAIRSATRRS